MKWCVESAIHWESIEWGAKYNDIAKANLSYRKQRKHTHKQTREMISRQLALLGKLLGDIRRQMRVHADVSLLTDKQKYILEIITKVYRQQKNHYKSGYARRVSWRGL